MKLKRRAISVENGIDIEQLKNLIDSELEKLAKSDFMAVEIAIIGSRKGLILFNQIVEMLLNIKFIWSFD